MVRCEERERLEDGVRDDLEVGIFWFAKEANKQVTCFTSEQRVQASGAPQ